MKRFLIFIIVVYIVNLTATINQTKEWTQIISSNRTEDAAYIAETIDGNYVITGETDSLNIGVAENAYLKKIDTDGNVIWSKTYPGTDGTGFVDALANGNFLIASATELIWTDADGIFCSNLSLTDFTITRMSKTSDAGYILMDNTTSGLGYFRIRKVNNMGAEVWTQYIDNDGNHQAYPLGSSIDSGASIIEASDGGFIITGWTYYGSDTGKNVYLVKTDYAGNVVWERSIGDGGHEKGAFAIEDTNGNILIV